MKLGLLLVGLASLTGPGLGMTLAQEIPLKERAQIVLQSTVGVELQFDNEITKKTGSGAVVDDRGWVLTSLHAKTLPEKILVHLPEGRSLQGKVIARDSRTDLVLIDVAQSLTNPLIPTQTIPEPGEALLAGLSTGPGEFEIEKGIVTSTERIARIATCPVWKSSLTGSIGSPVIGPQAEFVGIILDSDGQSSHIVPSVEIADFLSKIPVGGRDEMIVIKRPTPWLGVRLESDPNAGLVRLTVAPDSPAMKAGIQDQDELISIQGKPPGSLNKILLTVRKQQVGDQIELVVRRNGAEHKVQVMLEASPIEQNRILSQRGKPGRDFRFSRELTPEELEQIRGIFDMTNTRFSNEENFRELQKLFDDLIEDLRNSPESPQGPFNESP